MLLEEIASIFATSKLKNHSQRVAHITRGTTSGTRPALSHHPSGSFGPGGTPTTLHLFTFRFAPGGSFANAGDAEIARAPVDSTQRCSFTTNLTRSQRINVDKRVTFRVVVVDACAFAPARGWMRKRWQLLSVEGPSKRDALLLAPAYDSKVCRRSAYRHNTERTVQTRLMCELSFHHDPLLRFRIALLWVLHSGLNCLPRSAAALIRSKDRTRCAGVGSRRR